MVRLSLSLVMLFMPLFHATKGKYYKEDYVYIRLICCHYSNLTFYLICIDPYADWTPYQPGGFCQNSTGLGNPSTVQDCQALADKLGLDFASYYDNGNERFACNASSSCDAMEIRSGWTIYHRGNEY